MPCCSHVISSFKSDYASVLAAWMAFKGATGVHICPFRRWNSRHSCAELLPSRCDLSVRWQHLLCCSELISCCAIYRSRGYVRSITSVSIGGSYWLLCQLTSSLLNLQHFLSIQLMKLILQLCPLKRLDRLLFDIGSLLLWWLILLSLLRSLTLRCYVLMLLLNFLSVVVSRCRRRLSLLCLHRHFLKELVPSFPNRIR